MSLTVAQNDGAGSRRYGFVTCIFVFLLWGEPGSATEIMAIRAQTAPLWGGLSTQGGYGPGGYPTWTGRLLGGYWAVTGRLLYPGS